MVDFSFYLHSFLVLTLYILMLLCTCMFPIVSISKDVQFFISLSWFFLLFLVVLIVKRPCFVWYYHNHANLLFVTTLVAYPLLAFYFQFLYLYILYNFRFAFLSDFESSIKLYSRFSFLSSNCYLFITNLSFFCSLD